MSTFRLLFDETCVTTDRARVWRRTGVALLAAFLAVFSVNAKANVDNQPSVAIYYGNDVPVAMLDQFDWAVVESEHMGEGQLDALEQYGTQAFAYVSLGEAEHWRAGDTLPNEAFKARNEGWNSQAADLTRKEWGDYIINKRIRPLWSEGYRALFLDTLDSYRLFANDDDSVKAQQQALVGLIKRIRSEFPGVKLLLNRGFEILDQVRGDIVGVAAESLYKSWDVRTQSYRDVKPEDTQYVLDRLREVRNDYGLPAIAIDYVDPADRDTARQTARRIADDGIVPWVTNGSLNQVGVGSIEPMPRKVLVVYDKNAVTYGDFGNAAAHMYAAMPLEYLGYGAVYVDVNGPLPSDTLVGRYAGIVSWFDQTPSTGGNYRAWLGNQLDAGMRIAMFGDPGVTLSGELSARFGINEVGGPADGGLTPINHDGMVGFEGLPTKLPRREVAFELADANHASAHLTVRDDGGREFTPVVTGDWGGLAAAPWALEQSLGDQVRWIVDPFKFLKTALALPDMPVADPTTENGSRYWLTEVDGDAFNSRASAPGTPFNAQLLLDRILRKYRVPTTVSVITGEIGPDGLYPELAGQVEPIARDIFKLPWVEIGTHTYSHPFDWLGLKEGELTGKARTAAGYAYNLPLKNYRFDLEREIAGSTRYINENLAPPGKRVKAVLWSGDSIPPEKAIAIADRIGIANINGGNTSVRSDNPTMTQVSPMLRPFGEHIQVYSPQINENVYTNNMTGPLWGFRRVIETYKITDEPRRLKPIDIYFHFYSATYPASLKALNQVFSYALSQQTVPVYASTYSRIARNWYDVGVARTLDGGWQITGATQMRTLRVPEQLGWPDMRASRGVVGVRDLVQGRYVALSGEPRVTLRLANGAPSAPYVRRSNGRITQWKKQANEMSLEMASEYVPLEIELAGVAGCRVSAQGASRRGGGNTVTLRFNASTSGPVRIACG
ncbi:hypothetical protein T35B1_08969 [Salinisphaera shabanensis T35B1]|uniref:bifunctional glycoside hydrolase 114/ polysaccharide deacetylase family protein n=1 Tax=Salinisphaera shabanensis TaxID=180542 RepID=UPI0033420CDD